MILLVSDLIEVTIACDDDFLKVKETLTRIGIASRKDKKLWQSCHILHKKGKFYIVHFKELFALDNRPTNLIQDDIARRNTIVKLLQDWGLVKIVNPPTYPIPYCTLNQIKILPFKDKPDWELIPKYNIGKKVEWYESIR